MSPSQGSYLHSTAQTQNKRTHTQIPQVEFETTIPVFERAKAVLALDCAATEIGRYFLRMTENKRNKLASLITFRLIKFLPDANNCVVCAPHGCDSDSCHGGCKAG
jgi:hypothetical protein